jgi:uncharacterized protein (DUF433 family)
MIKSATQSIITRTERGLTISGTRITIYDILDFLKAEWPRTLIREYFELTDAQLDAALDHIEEHRAAVEAEYQQVLREAEENRQYWEERNRDRNALIARLPPKPGMEQAWAKLQAAKARRAAIHADPR